MINTTIISINVISLMTLSPFYTLHASQKVLKTSIYNSNIINSLSSFLFSNTKFHKTVLNGNTFSHFLNTPIVFINIENPFPNCIFFSDKSHFLFTKDEIISNQTVKPEYFKNYPYDDTFDERNSRPFFKEGCGNITMTNCIFDSCYAETYHGGSIHIEQDCHVIIHNTIFNNSYTGKFCGGAAYIVKSGLPEENGDTTYFTEGKLPQLNIQFCCFQYCYGKNKVETNQIGLLGVAIFSAAENTIFHYTSTVDCPGLELNDGKEKPDGSQFDLQANTAMLSYMNATGGNAKLCSAIECRHAEEISFKFQTISFMKGQYAISFNDIKSPSLHISNTNIFNIELNDEEASSNMKTIIQVSFISILTKYLRITQLKSVIFVS